MHWAGMQGAWVPHRRTARDRDRALRTGEGRLNVPVHDKRCGVTEDEAPCQAQAVARRVDGLDALCIAVEARERSMLCVDQGVQEAVDLGVESGRTGHDQDGAARAKVDARCADGGVGARQRGERVRARSLQVRPGFGGEHLQHFA